MKIRTSVSSRAFTLVELLVVLSLVAAAGAMVGPDLWGTLGKQRERSEAARVALELRAQQRTAFISGVGLRIENGKLLDSLGIDFGDPLPSGWLIDSNSQINFLPSGATSGGTVELIAPSGRHWSISMAPLDGEIIIKEISR